MRRNKTLSNRRWVNARPGSVLILVIALLVLLALIGTAYLSSTQTERYTAHQNDINTEADLLIQGMVNTLNGSVANALFGNTSTGVQYRPVDQEMPSGTVVTTTTPVSSTGYYHYDSATPGFPSPTTPITPDPVDLWLAPRLPVLPNPAMPPTLVTGGSPNPPTWSTLSYPLFKDASGQYTFDSPIGGNNANSGLSSIQVSAGIYKGVFQGQPTTVTLPDGTVGPGMQIVYNGAASITGLSSITRQDGSSITAGSILGTIYAGDASGSGIADSVFTKVPVGQIDGVTYYVAIRVVDNNSAINASSAWTQGNDTLFSGATNPPTNYGFFRSNIGLLELLNHTTTGQVATAANEISALNTYRFGQGLTTPGTGTTSPPMLLQQPLADSTSIAIPSNFSWYSYEDALENQLTRRPGNPGKNGTATNYQTFQWLGLQQSAALAYKSCLFDINTPVTPLEQVLPNELIYHLDTTGAQVANRSVPYSPSDVLTWYSDQYQMMNNYVGTNIAPSSFPIRPILTGTNAVSNAIPSRLGNTSASTPMAWVAGTTYVFGDWVVGPDGRSYVCLIPNIGQTPLYVPPGTTHTNSDNYWAFVPWSTQPTKTSINTATFEQLYLAFAQVMTDTIDFDTIGALPGTVKQWQPPRQPTLTVTTNAQPQMPMFYSTLRPPQDLNNPLATRLTASQMLKIRAACAAVNAIDLRGGTTAASPGNTSGVPVDGNVVTSKRIVLADASTNNYLTGTQSYEVEVYGTKPQCYISEMVAEIEPPSSNPNAPAVNFMAIELVNMTMQDMDLTNWALCTVDRSSFGQPDGMSMTTLMGPGVPVIKVPKATRDPTTGVITPGIAVVASAPAPTSPAGTMPPISLSSSNLYIVPNLASAIGKELFLVRPRVYGVVGGQTNPLSKSSDAQNPFDETSYLGDLVPVDQLDLTGIDTTVQSLPPTQLPARLQYRRGSAPGLSVTNSPSYTWNFIYPGTYSPLPTAGNPRMAGIIIEKSPNLSSGNLGIADAGPPNASSVTSANTTYATAPIQMCNLNTAGPNPLNYATPTAVPYNTFPFGQFARNGDMLQVPFIASYRIRQISSGTRMTPGHFTELNSVTMDSTFAMDSSSTMQASAAAATKASGISTPSSASLCYEQIGRFCPVGDPAGADDSLKLDFGSTPSYWHYHWGEKIFNYLTVQSPQDDYYPNVDPAPFDVTVSPASPARYPSPGATATTAGLPPVVPIGNNNSVTVNAITPGSTEDTVGVEGLININTAPLVVLAQLPFCATYTPSGAPQTPDVQAANNAALAKAIVANRDKYGPFKSIFDLYRVPEFAALNSAMTLTATGPANGNFSPTGIVPATTPVSYSGVRFDFNDRFLLLNNISNLITTRSDTFTCYILLQGWRGVGTANPVLAVQRRASFIVDRNGVVPSNIVPMNFKMLTE